MKLHQSLRGQVMSKKSQKELKGGVALAIGRRWLCTVCGTTTSFYICWPSDPVVADCVGGGCATCTPLGGCAQLTCA